MQLRLHLLGTTAALCLVTSVALADDVPQRRTISVTGQGEVKTAPDLAIVSFAVETTAPDAEAAVDNNARKSAALAEAIKKRLGAKDKVTTTRYSLNPVYEQRERGSTAPPKISGYVVQNEVRVETHSIDAVGRLIDTAAGAGANRINALQFRLENENEQLAEALQQAGAHARQQAESVASALGVRLVHVVSATTSVSPPILPKPYMTFGMAAEARAPTPVEPGEVTVSATLHVTYEIE